MRRSHNTKVHCDSILPGEVQNIEDKVENALSLYMKTLLYLLTWITKLNRYLLITIFPVILFLFAGCFLFLHYFFFEFFFFWIFFKNLFVYLSFVFTSYQNTCSKHVRRLQLMSSLYLEKGCAWNSILYKLLEVCLVCIVYLRWHFVMLVIIDSSLNLNS